jgi:transcriptional regulatory protein LevR/transcriptional regulator with AAA-type ATPase domain
MKKIIDKVYELVKQRYEESGTGILTGEVAAALAMQRSNASAALNQLVKEGRLQKTASRPVQYYLIANGDLTTEETVFHNVIGYNGSLKNAVALAKAAILYPQGVVKALIIGERSTGKKYLANLMVQYGRDMGQLDKQARVVHFDCAQYSGDAARLEAALFSRQDGQFARAEGGALCLSGANQLILAESPHFRQLRETGQLTYLGDDHPSNVNVFLILTCHPDVSAAVRDELAANTPFVINLPALAQRPLSERLEFINRFFAIESSRANAAVSIDSEILRCLLLYDCPGNLRQLNMEIKQACAKGYVRDYGSRDNTIYLHMSDFSPEVRKGFLNYPKNRDEVARIIPSDYQYVFDKNNAVKKYENFNRSSDVYNQISANLHDLIQEGVDDNSARLMTQDNIDQLFTRYFDQVGSNDEVNIEQLSKIVDYQVIETVRAFIAELETQTGRKCPSSAFYGLCLHINNVIRPAGPLQPLSDEYVVSAMRQHPAEYLLCGQFAQQLSQQFNTAMDADQIAIMTNIVTAPGSYVAAVPQVLFCCHGENGAQSQKDVVQSLSRSNNVHSFDMSLDSDINHSYQQLKELVQRIDRGKGIIAIYDMGSFKNMLETISGECGIAIRMIWMPAALVGIDAARKCLINDDLDAVYHELLQDLEALHSQDASSAVKPPVIVTLCNTGEGGARQLKEYIDRYSALKIPTIPLAISNRQTLTREVAKIREDKEIYAFVGTYDPQLFGIPFISITDVLGRPADQLDEVLKQGARRTSAPAVDYDAIYAYFAEQFTHVDIARLRKAMDQFLRQIRQLQPLDEAQEVGLLTHTACVIESTLAGRPPRPQVDSERILNEYPELFRQVSKCVRPLEKDFDMIFPDCEIANMMRIIKRIR